MAMKAKELAQLMGVSAATMSLVLNNKPGISSELRNTLLHRIRTLGYGYMIKGNEDGADGEKKKIAYLIYPGEGSQKDGFAFYPSVLEGVEREAHRQGYQLMVVHMDENVDSTFMQRLHEECQGIVVQAEREKEEIKKHLEMIDLPAVITACQEEYGAAMSISIDHESGVKKAVAYLKKKGHQRISYVGSCSLTDTARKRLGYYKLAMQEEKLDDKEVFLIKEANGAAETNTEECLRILWEKMGDRFPTALILENDLLAPAVYRTLRQLGKRIPEDVSVIGFDGREICSMMDPPLTTVRVPRRLMGRMLMTMLDQQIKLQEYRLKNTAVRMLVDAELVEMGSVAAI